MSGLDGLCALCFLDYEECVPNDLLCDGCGEWFCGIHVVQAEHECEPMEESDG